MWYILIVVKNIHDCVKKNVLNSRRNTVYCIPDLGEIYPCCVGCIPYMSLTMLILYTYIPTILSYITLTVAKYIPDSGGIYVSLTVAEYSIQYVSLTVAQYMYP